jgi:hypothetical protein
VPNDGWITHLTLNAPSPTVDYDMTVSPGGDIRLVSFALSNAVPYQPQPHLSTPSFAALIGIVLGAVFLCATLVLLRLRPRRSVANPEGANPNAEEH